MSTSSKVLDDPRRSAAIKAALKGGDVSGAAKLSEDLRTLRGDIDTVGHAFRDVAFVF